jgi:hypothetical protein
VGSRGLAGDVAAGEGGGCDGAAKGLRRAFRALLSVTVGLVTWQPVREWEWWVRGLAGDVAAGVGVWGVMVLPRARDARLEPCYP